MGMANEVKAMEETLRDEFWTYACRAASAGENLPYDDFVIFVENKAIEFSRKRKDVLF